MPSSPEPEDQCFYCGLPFAPVSAPPSDPKLKKLYHCARRTTMQYYYPVQPGEAHQLRYVTVHSWCNSRARHLSYEERVALKQELSHKVQVHQSPPWEHPELQPTGKQHKKLRNKQLKQKLAEENDGCFYCSMPFNIVPVKQNAPLHGKLAKWARKAMQIRYADGERIAILAHHWCLFTIGDAPEKDKAVFKTVMTAHCTGRVTLPWIDKKLLEQYRQLGGDTLELITRLDQALQKAGR